MSEPLLDYLPRGFMKLEPEPVGYAVLDAVGDVLHLTKCENEAKEWRDRLPGRTVRPVYL
jgi:hypothetical protein